MEGDDGEAARGLEFLKGVGDFGGWEGVGFVGEEEFEGAVEGAVRFSGTWGTGEDLTDSFDFMTFWGFLGRYRGRFFVRFRYIIGYIV